jgi:4-alpha-glucanotransferase
VQLLPVNETGGDHSPYNAISSVALEPTTIEITPDAIPDLTAADLRELASPAEIAPLRAGPVQYPAVKALKARLLERAFEHFTAGSWKKRDARARRFQKFCRTQATWLEGYALFRMLMEENGGTERWDWWPAEHHAPDAATRWFAALPTSRRRALELRVRFRKYIQWIAWEQWRAVKEHATARGVALMGDIPFGVSYYSADVWAQRGLFDEKWCGGCPPERLLKVDEFTYKWGQNWGIPLYRWAVHRASDFAWWRQRVHKVRDVFHLFRIDHILGVFRIYGFPWRPERNAEFLPLTEAEAAKLTGGTLPHFVARADDTDKHKAANHAQGREILRALVEESGEHRLVGEDLGMVPDYVRPCLHQLGIAGFKVPQWEIGHDGEMIPGAKYERLSLSTYATHDHPPLRTMWEDWMAAIHAAEKGGAETWAARDAAWGEARRLARWCGFEVPRITPFSEAIHRKILHALFASESWMAVLMLTDLFGTRQRFNVPGAVSDANWTERVDDLRAPAWIREMLAETGRGR